LWKFFFYLLFQNNIMIDFLVIDGCEAIEGGMSKVYSLNKEDLEYETKRRKLK